MDLIEQLGKLGVYELRKYARAVQSKYERLVNLVYLANEIIAE